MATSMLAMLPNVKADFCGISPFLSIISKNWEELIGYVQKMIELRFMVPFSDITIIKLSEWYDESDSEEKKRMIKRWEETLLMANEDEKYKAILLTIVREVISKTKETINNRNEVWRALLYAGVLYSNQHIEISFSETTGISTRLVKD